MLAESAHTEMVEGNHYFPPDMVLREHLRDSATHTSCPWKGLGATKGLFREGLQNDPILGRDMRRVFTCSVTTAAEGENNEGSCYRCNG